MVAALPDAGKKERMQHPVAVRKGDGIQVAAVMRAIGSKAIFEVGLVLGEGGQRQGTGGKK